jgi:enamine deaminase RidA (YjgF/YER057c/UK114 family)
MPTRRVIAPDTLPKPFGVWSPAILSEGGKRTLYISGLTARDPSGAVVGEGDYRVQTKQVCENLKAAVEAVGGTLANIVSVNVFVMDAGQFKTIHEVRREYFPSEPPASTMVEVTSLVDKRCLIEINAIAVLD